MKTLSKEDKISNLREMKEILLAKEERLQKQIKDIDAKIVKLSSSAKIESNIINQFSAATSTLNR